jgi:hypothetical protein
VPYGESISRNGKHVWVGLDEDERIICVAATADEARRKVKGIRRSEEAKQAEAKREGRVKS